MPKLTDAEIETLKARLDPLTYAIAFEEGTERAFTHPLNTEKRAGDYHCKVCGEALFKADHKYESGSGWPSFYDAADRGAVDTLSLIHISEPTRPY